MDVFFTEHRILSPHLLNDQTLQQERKKRYNLRNAKNLGLQEDKFEERYRLVPSLPTYFLFYKYSNF